MNTDTRYIMAAIKFTLITVACMLVYMSYNATAAQVADVEAKRPMPKGAPAVVAKGCGALSHEPGVFPTGVMLQEIGGKARTLIIRDDVVVGQALEKQINGKDYLPTYRVLQFCK